MTFRTWLQNLRTALSGQRDHRRRGPPRAASHRLTVEALEDRLTPSFYSLAEGSSEAPPGVVWSPPPPLLADFTSDGIPDRIRPGGYRLVVEPGLGDGTFAEPIDAGARADYLAVADFNGDGRLDVFTVDLTGGIGDNAFGNVLLGRGDGTFFGELESLSISYFPTRIGTGDFNSDGQEDVVIDRDDFVVGGQVFEVLINDGTWPDVSAPRLRIAGAPAVTEGNTGTRTASFTVTLSAVSTQSITVTYATANGTATAGSDFQAASGILTFAPGETSKTVTVPVNGDRLAEPNETFFVNLGNSTNATIADAQGVATIVDDEPRISIGDVTKSEGRRGQTTLFTFTVTLSAAYDQAVTMSFRTANGTATTGNGDYVARTGTLTFAPGETTKTITIEVKGDSKREANEYFYLDLFGNSGNSLFTKNRGLGTILNDD